ncbi:MAG: hypothetical protein KGL39_09375 [Patescibacteria group bacterium]|nr:hypothetical protein [Patescibacteria group bacterium]
MMATETKADISAAIVSAAAAPVAGSEYVFAVLVRVIWNCFLESRGLRPAGDATEPTREKIVREIDSRGLFRIDARRTTPRGARDYVIIYVLSDKGKYTHKSDQLASLLLGVKSEPGARDGKLDEVILVAPPEFFYKKNLVGVVEGYQKAEAPETPADLEGKAAFYSMYPYHLFVTDLRKRKDIPRHTVMSPEDADRELKAMRLSGRDVPTIYETDPPAVWEGARAGQLLKIVRDSETAMTAVTYRLVIRPTVLPFSARQKAAPSEREERE